MVQRSSDGRLFRTIATLPARGNSNGLISYSDAGPNYYRLKQVDAGGTFSYSPVRPINFQESRRLSIQVFPNSCAGGMPDVRDSDEGTVFTLQSGGRVIRCMVLTKETHSFVLNTKGLAPCFIF